jgi:hypothetical protein
MLDSIVVYAVTVSSSTSLHHEVVQALVAAGGQIVHYRVCTVRTGSTYSIVYVYTYPLSSPPLLSYTIINYTTPSSYTPPRLLGHPARHDAREDAVSSGHVVGHSAHVREEEVSVVCMYGDNKQCEYYCVD